MMRRSNNLRGFTIVELLIVIVVIGILAAITIVAFNGIQNRTNNTKTVNAVSAYVKVLQLYKIDNGQHPDATSCLGLGYVEARCHGGSALYVEDGGGLNTGFLSPYLQGKVPIPNTARVPYTSTMYLAGAFYNYNVAGYNTAGGGIGFAQIGVTSCPSVGGTRFVSSTLFEDGSGLWCRVAID